MLLKNNTYTEKPTMYYSEYIQYWMQKVTRFMQLVCGVG